MTMIEHPKIGEGVETRFAREHGLLDASPRHCGQWRGLSLMQDTWLVTADGGEPLAGLPMRIVRAGESQA
jgi:hypothetical protein